MNNQRQFYNKQYIDGVETSLEWLKQSEPALWFDFVTKILPKMSDIEECRQKIQENEQKITQLDSEIKAAAVIVSGKEAVIGSSFQKERLSLFIEPLLKSGLSSVPIVTLFAITGVTSILNPFINAQQRWGVFFLILSSVSFVLLTSAGIVKIIHRLSSRHWRYKFWGLTVQSWFVIACLVFGLVEGLGGGALASNLIDNATAAANELRETPLPFLDFWTKAKTTAIMTLFAYVNIFFSVAKGFEIRVLQPYRVRKSQALSKLEITKVARQELIENNHALASKIESLKQEVAFVIPSEEWQRNIRNLSNQVTLGQDFNGKHPGTYINKTLSSNFQSTNNGHISVNPLSKAP